MLDSHSASLLLRQQVYDLVSVGEKLALAVVEFAADESMEAQFADICELLSGTLGDANVSAPAVSLVIDAASMPLKSAWQIRCERLGAGPLFATLPQRTLPTSFWEEAWQMRGNHMLRLVYASHVAAQTRLLPDERAPGVAGGTCLQVPTGTAWITAEVDVAGFIGARGVVDETRLGQCLVEIVERGDRTHSAIRWPTAQMRHDSWLNRRLSISVKGIGTLVQKRNIDPGHFAGLNEMHELLLRIRQILFAATHELACRDGIVPALDQADPGRLLPGGRIGEGWAWRWRQALEAAAVRNRNLLALSPWSLFPPGPADLRYTNLLPLLRHADVCSFAGPADVSAWNLKDFKNFHQQAAAVLHQRNEAHQIAVHA